MPAAQELARTMAAKQPGGDREFQARHQRGVLRAAAFLKLRAIAIALGNREASVLRFRDIRIVRRREPCRSRTNPKRKRFARHSSIRWSTPMATGWNFRRSSSSSSRKSAAISPSADSFPSIRASRRRSSATPEQRKAMRRAQEAFWAVPTRNTLDRATELMPKLLYERLDEFGIDFTVLYPTSALGVPFHPDAETRRITCRAFNTFIADYFGEFSDRMTPAAVIPMHTPEEAIEELEHAVKKLGLKVVMMASMVRRRTPAEQTTGGARAVRWFDMLGLDSEYDYDPVWAKCVELGVSPTFHSGSRGIGLRVSPTNFVYNHIGHFAAASEAVCKAMFMGGVTRRFPTLKMGFLEGGVGWACGAL